MFHLSARRTLALKMKILVALRCGKQLSNLPVKCGKNCQIFPLLTQLTCVYCVRDDSGIYPRDDRRILTSAAEVNTCSDECIVQINRSILVLSLMSYDIEHIEKFSAQVNQLPSVCRPEWFNGTSVLVQERSDDKHSRNIYKRCESAVLDLTTDIYF